MSEAEKKPSSDEELRRVWMQKIERADRAMEPWRERAKKVTKRFKDERPSQGSTARRYALLWSNVMTLGPAVYSRPPAPVVAGRWKDGDPVTRLAAECLERCLTYLVEDTKFDERLVTVRTDYLLAARGVAWVRYVAEVETEETPAPKEGEEPAAPVERLKHETIELDHVAFDDFGHGPGRTWQEVEFAWRRVYLSRDSLVKRFGEEIGKAVKLDQKAEGAHEEDPPEKAVVYEVWNKAKREVLWFAKSYDKGPLDRRDDMYGLKDFWPFPLPLYGTIANDKLEPVPDYVFYQDQAEEIDELTMRIGKLTDALRMVGVYAADEKTDLSRMLKPGQENVMIPVDGWVAFKEKGGVKGLIEWLPVDMVVQVLEGCYQSRRQLIEDVYQITGISDIVRGASDPRETATAQQLKGQWGALRIRDRQSDIQRFCRDIVRIMGELAAEKFGQDTLAAMSGMQLPTKAELEAQQQQMMLQAQQAALMAQQQGAEPPPPPEPPAPQPTWEDVIERLRDDPARRFSMEIETDSTIAADEDAEKARRTEFLTAVGGMLQQGLPVVQMAPEAMPMIGEMLLFTARGFRAGRQLEEAIEKFVQSVQERMAQPPAPPQPTPIEQAKIEEGQQKVQIQAFDAETKRMKVQGDQQMAANDQIIQAAGHDLAAQEQAFGQQAQQEDRAIRIDEANARRDLEGRKVDLQAMRGFTAQ
ncbi:hypothetical protein [Geminicoccus harenae]|uniref:hypothetical protein n=1 Tax=Geminicoccus harenae TaxID=2498453 RepID=UPI00168A59C9|nr:hypothetical protein [Geminicoccus harenae]